MLWSTYWSVLVMYSPISATSFSRGSAGNIKTSRFNDVRGGSVDIFNDDSEVPVSRTRSRLFSSSSLKAEIKKDSDSDGLNANSLSSLREVS